MSVPRRSSPRTGWRPATSWTLPVGAQVGRLIKLADKLPVNLLLGAYYNALRPEFGPTWQLRSQVTFIF